MCQTKQGFLYSSVIQLLFHAPLLPFGRNLNLVPWGKNHRFFKFKESFPHTRLPSSLRSEKMSILPSFYHKHLVLTDTCWKISDSTWFSSPWSARSLSVFLPPDLKVHRPSLSTYEPLFNAPKDFSAGQSWEWTSQEWGDWNAASGPSAVTLCKTPLSLTLPPAEAWWPSPKGDLDSLTPRPWYHLSLEREGQHRALFQGDWPCLWGLLLPISLPSLLS